MFGPSHVDVAPVEDADAWEEDPFSGIVRDDCVWGRGALDMLFIVAAQVQTFADLHNEGFEPKGDLILLVVSDEEEEGQYSTKWMFKNYPELVQTDYAVTEAGGWPLESGKIALTIGEKGTTQSVGDGKLTSFRNVSPIRSEFVDAMERAVRKEVPEATLFPILMPSKTDSMFLRKRESTPMVIHFLTQRHLPVKERSMVLTRE